MVFPSPIKAAQKVAASITGAEAKTEERPTSARPPTNTAGIGDRTLLPAASGVRRKLRRGIKSRIADFAIRQRDVSSTVAHADAEVEVMAASAGSARVTVQYTDKGKPVTLTTLATLRAGSNVIDLPVEIRDPKLWYPAGYGEQPLYEFTAQVGVGSQQVETRKVKAGLRSIVLDRHLDKWGRSFRICC